MIRIESQRFIELQSKVDNNPRLTPLYNAEQALEEVYDLPFNKKIKELQKQINYLEDFFPKIRTNGLPKRQRCFQNVSRALTTLYQIQLNIYE